MSEFAHGCGEVLDGRVAPVVVLYLSRGYSEKKRIDRKQEGES